MALKITLVRASGNVALSRNNHIFDQCGGTFGRADSNTWVLPDPEKFLSSCHCAIVFIDSQYYLEDKSTNGTFVNGGFEPLGRGTRHQLRNDDFFEIGDFRFSIQLEQKSQDFFASPFDVVPSQTNASSFENLPKNDFFGEELVDSSALFNQQQDPLALWDQRPQQRAQFNLTPEYTSGKETNSLLDDFVGLGRPTNDVAFSAIDMNAGIDQSLSWPTAKAENVIPENWDDDIINKPVDLVSPTSNSKAPIEDDWLSPFSTNTTSAPHEIPFDIPKPSARIPLAERVAAIEAQQPKIQPLPVSVQHQDALVLPIVAPVIEEVPQPQQVLVPSIPNHTGSVANHTLVESLGLDMSRLSEADIVEINRISGLLIREIVDGMLGVLRSRASIKNEFRMNVTTIQPIENNPLKFSVCVDDALENLFIKKSNAYKKPVEAFREGFQEIAEHQLAMIAGIRQGFEAMMERFNPEQLEKSFNKQVKGSVIPGMQKAKYWNNYTDYYQGFTDNMESSFQHLFGSDFVSAYEDQLRRLTAARKRGESNDKL